MKLYDIIQIVVAVVGFIPTYNIQALVQTITSSSDTALICISLYNEESIGITENGFFVTVIIKLIPIS